MRLKITDWGTLILLTGQGKEEDPQRHQGGEGVESCGFLVCSKNKKTKAVVLGFLRTL